MKVALLCPGPSLASFPGIGPAGYDLVIGVNRAALAHPCHVWACGDYPMVERIRGQVLGKPVLFTAANSAAFLRDHSTPWTGETVEFESLHGFCDRDSLKWEMFTVTAALTYAAHEIVKDGGVGAVECFGMDWVGERDWDGDRGGGAGDPEGGNRSPDRWKFEREIWTALVEHFRRAGIVVNRIGKRA